MADLAHIVGQDLQIGSSGDLATVSAADETQQRILHRLLTGAGTYIWQPTYGAGLPSLIGSTASQQRIAAIIRTQIAYEQSVALDPEPQVTLTGNLLGSVSATIAYTDASTGADQVLTLPIGG